MNVPSARPPPNTPQPTLGVDPGPGQCYDHLRRLTHVSDVWWGQYSYLDPRCDYQVGRRYRFGAGRETCCDCCKGIVDGGGLCKDMLNRCIVHGVVFDRVLVQFDLVCSPPDFEPRRRA